MPSCSLSILLGPLHMHMLLLIAMPGLINISGSVADAIGQAH